MRLCTYASIQQCSNTGTTGTTHACNNRPTSVGQQGRPEADTASDYNISKTSEDKNLNIPNPPSPEYDTTQKPQNHKEQANIASMPQP
eukprot:8067131-Lingulodinium_polyedra.AAC.1